MNQVTEIKQNTAVRASTLQQDDFKKLESLIAENFKVEPKFRRVTVPVRDDLGHVYRWEHDLIDDGFSIAPIGEAHQRLVEAVQHPTTHKHTIFHLTRLSAHLRHTKGEGALQVILEDISRDLAGVSEWAIVKACEIFRHEGKPFFPDTPTLMAEVKKWHEFSQRLTQKEPARLEKELPKSSTWKELPKPTAAQKEKVKKLAELATKALQGISLTPDELKFIETSKRVTA